VPQNRFCYVRHVGVALRADEHSDVQLTDERARLLIGALWDASETRGGATVAAEITEELRLPDSLRRGIDVDARGIRAVDAALVVLDA
jgi:hypothetical protein